ncbi:hypothetical protein ACEWY4_012884 [Coilia grayii]|uniref:Actin-associated protein FAM107A n=1 Tax=Coilia grayii TaxID=363190 RepID=A0ABD1JUP6_9TELE
MGVTHGKKTDHDLSYPHSTYGKAHSSPVARRGRDSGGGEAQRGQRDGGLELGRASPSPSTRSSELGHGALIQPRKLINPVKVSRSHQALHRELLLSHRSEEEKPELQRVLEQRRRRMQARQRHDDQQRGPARPTPLQQELLKRQHRLDMLERELEKQREQLANEPEFIRVKDSLRRTTSMV